jgi:hypothetical protein
MPDRGILQLISMAKKTIKAKAQSARKTGAETTSMPDKGIQKKEEYSLDIPEAPQGVKKPISDRLKWVAVLILAALVVILAAFFYISSQSDFIPGQNVSADQFKGLLVSAQKVYIVMDIRGVQNSTLRGNIMQCGVDFASSTFLGSKTVIPMSFDSTQCIDADGTHPLSKCAAELKDGIAIDIRGGQPAVRYFSNGMLVTIGPEYKLGACGIKSS